jgi:hypothetical protein
MTPRSITDLAIADLARARSRSGRSHSHDPERIEP